ncbi:MAG TPA: GNAT family N-acetyltransferase [Steroidobacteraceae bacterium]|nr:GNAT family N-acetyltransferase [Steroidobacteraceae bacterium]
MNVPIEFDTPRLSLRQWQAADREPFAALNADPIVMAHFPAPMTRQESDAMASHCERLLAERRWGVWACEVKETREFIGCVGLNIPRRDLPVSPCVEILWRLARAHWRRGFATEAARGATRVGFEVLRLPEIVAFTVPSNGRSRAVMERLGMQMDAATFEHPGVPEGHVLRTHCNYRLSRDRWLAIESGDDRGTGRSAGEPPR